MAQNYTRNLFLLVFSLLLSATRPGLAQGWLGIANSNYAGTNSLYFNPGAIADTRQKFYINFGAGDLNFYNTYLQLDMPYTPWQLVRGKVGPEHRNSEGKVRFSSAYLREQSLSGKTQSASVTAEARLPSFMVSLGDHHTVAFSNRVRAFAQASNVSQNVARLARYGLPEAERLGLANQLLTDNSFNVNVNSYHEFALTYARTFTRNRTHFLKGGLTLKYLVGLGSAYVVNQGVSYQVYKGGDSIQLGNRDMSYGYTDYRYYDRSDFKVGDLYGKKRLGRGAGGDLGIVYEFRPNYAEYDYRMDDIDRTDNTQHKYKLRVGLALTDIGAVFYSHNQYVRRAQLTRNPPRQLGSLDTLSYKDMNTSVDERIHKMVGLTQRGPDFISSLPTAINLTADYKVRNHLYAGLAWTQSILPRDAIGSRAVSSVSVAPRLEYSQAEVSLPIVLANNYQQLQLGAMVRLGPVFVGSDNLGGIFGATTLTGYDVYGGVGFTLGKKKIKDRDYDQVSDKLDKCPDVKGTWEFKGCPDRDGDHIEDIKDACPTVPGVAEFRGCPDRDGDHVQDSDDDCPDEPGIVAMHGCPDRDNDGVKDAEDHCPDVAGPAEHFGCPDTDQDGVYDDTDDCLEVPGAVENKGCPWPDTDGDTVLDKDDACPTVAGTVANKGCPNLDTDGDKVLDKDDLCPHTPGPVANKGCPVITRAQQKVVSRAFVSLKFQTNKDVILRTSYASLNQLATLLKTKPAFRLRLTGHTDNVGKPAYNLVLSRKRAEAVRRYLVQRGVPTEHIRTEAFGQTKPVASNKTAAGRARNRRVEMKVLFD